MKHRGKTPAFHGPHGEVVPGSIAEVEYCRLGGLDQWVMICGESVANPPLILLHGGPGWSETRRFPSLQRAARAEVYRRLLGSARRRQVVRPRRPTLVDER